MNRDELNPELCLVGCCLLGGVPIILRAAETVEAGMIQDPDCQEAFRGLLELATTGKAINLWNVNQFWKATHRGAGLPVAIIGSTEAPPCAEVFGHYADEIVAEAERRRLMCAASDIVSRCQDPEVDTLTALDASLPARKARQDPTVFTALESCRLLTDDLEARHALQGKLSGIGTGFYDFDNKTDGLQAGEQTVIGARPSIGKTALGIAILAHACLRNQVPTLFISLEMGIAALMRRLVSFTKEVPMKKLRNGQFDEGHFKSITTFTASVARQPMYFVNGVAGLTTSQVGRHIVQHVVRYGVRLVIIDYLQKITPDAKHEKRTYEVAGVSNALKAFADTHKIAMLTLAQLNREPDKGKDCGRFPRVSDLADSSQIERDADLIGLLHRTRDPSDMTATLLIAKQRDGELGAVTLQFRGEFCRFENPQRYP